MAEADEASGARPKSQIGGASLALVISILSGIVSVFSFGFSLANDVRGSDVHLFPLESVLLYHVPHPASADRDWLGVSVRTEFANTAGSNYPDSIVSERLEISVDGAPYACLASRGLYQTLRAPKAEGREVILPPAPPAAPESPECDADLCVVMNSGWVLSIATNVSARQTLRPGEIASTNSYYDHRAVSETHACAQLSEQRGLADRPNPQVLLAGITEADEGATRAISLTYHVQTLHDGAFTATCEIEATAPQLQKFRQDGWISLGCARAPEPVHERPASWRRLFSG